MEQRTGPRQPAERYRIGDLILSAGTRELVRGDRRLKLQRRAFDALLHLVRHRDRVVDKDELWRDVWESRPVSDSVIPRAISRVRHVLGDGDESWIQTVHGVGYRFVRPVEPLAEEDPAGTTPPRARALARPIALALLLVGLGTALGLWLRAPPAPPRIAILPVEVEPGAELEWIRFGVLPLMEQALADEGLPPVPSGAIRATLARHEGVSDRAEQARILRLTHGADQVWLPRLRLEGGQYQLTLGRLGSDASVSVAGSDPVLVAVGATTRLRESVNWRTDRNRPYRKVITDDPFVNEAYARGLDARLRSDWEAAEAFLETVLSAAPDLHWAKYQLSLCTRRLGQWDRTARLNEEMLAAARDIGDRELEGSVQSTSGTLAWRLGDLKAAEQWYLEAEQTFEAIDSRHSIASVYTNLAILASVRGQFDEAEALYGRALGRYRELADAYNESAVLKNLGLMHVDRGDLVRARDYVERSLRIRQRLGLEREVALDLSALADIDAREGRWPQALGGHRRALEAARKAGDRINEAESLADICQIHRHQGQLDAAREVCGESLFVARQIANPAAEAKALLIQAQIELDASRFGPAAELNDRAGAMYRQLGYADGIAHTTLLELELALAQQPDADYGALLGRAGEACEEAGNDLHCARWRSLQARVLGRAGDLDGALESWARALELVDGSRNPLARLDLHSAHTEWAIDQSLDTDRFAESLAVVESSALETAASQRALALYFARSGQREKSRRAAGKWRELAGQAWSERDQERFDALLDGSP